MQSVRDSFFPPIDDGDDFARQSMAFCGGAAQVFPGSNLRNTRFSTSELRKTDFASSELGESEPPPLPPPPPEKTLAAIFLVVLAGIVATLQGAAIQITIRYGFRWSALVTQSSFIGGLFFGFIQLINGVPFVTHPSKLNPMLKRGLYGGIANCCAYYAVRYSNKRSCCIRSYMI